MPDENQVVNPVPVTPEPPAGEPQVPAASPESLPGDKTPNHLLLKSLQEERDKRKKAEDDLADLIASSSSSDALSDEGKLLQGQIAEQNKKIDALLGESARKDVLIAHPVLKDMWGDFETFRDDPENKGMNLRTAAKAFLTEKGLLEPQRKGLEKPTGGARVAPTQGMSAEDIKVLRETNPKKYSEMLAAGEIKF